MTSLIKPLYISILRRLDAQGSRADKVRNWFFLGFGFVILCMIYRVTTWSIGKITESPQLSQIPPAQFFSLVLTFLFVMLIVSGIFSALGLFFSAQDLDLLRKAPLSWQRFFGSRFTLAVFIPSWMPLLFLTPFFVAFQVAYQGPWWFTAAAIVALIPFFMIPASLACIASQLLSVLLPWRRARELALVAFIGLLIVSVQLFSDLNLGMSSSQNSKEILKILSILSVSDIRWLPSTWTAELLGELLKGKNDRHILNLFLLLYTAAAALYFWTSLIFKAFYERSYGSAAAGSAARLSFIPKFHRVFNLLPVTIQTRGLIKKEWFLVSRDVGQLLQLVLLLGVTGVYLSHLRAFTVVSSFPGSMQKWWTSFLFVSNISMAAFLATALCVRFVYPSISLDGRSFWLLETSPVTVEKMLRAKRLFYAFPLALLMLAFFVMGAQALDVSIEVTLLSAFCAMSLCYALVSLALGLGAYFARFDWEHQAELAGSFGGLLFMFSSIALIFVSMAPTWILLVPTLDNDAVQVKIPLLASSLALVSLMHILIARKAFEIGANKLRSRQK